MRRPTFANLAKLAGEPPSVRYCSGSPWPLGNPRHFKHLWQLFSAESPWEDDDFFEHAPLLCGADFLREAERLVQAGLTCLVYGQRRPRPDPTHPWDRSGPRWRNAVFAPCWDEDPDPVYHEEHK